MTGEDRLSRRRFLWQSALLGAGLRPLGRASARETLRYRIWSSQGWLPAANCLARSRRWGASRASSIAGTGWSSSRIRPDATAEAAISTHPELVAAVVRACREAGAAEVLVASHDDARSFVATGIAAAATGAGCVWEALEQRERYREVPVPRGRILRREAIAIPVLEADVFINLPIVKQSPEVEISVALKNLMGVNWDRLRFHRADLNACIAELASVVPHELVIADANHVLLTNGRWARAKC